MLRTNAHVSDDGAVANIGHSILWRVMVVLGLSLVVGSGWLLTEAYPSELAFPFAGCEHFAMIGLAGLLVGMRTGWQQLTRGTVVRVAAAGVALFVLPGVVGQFTAGAVSESTTVALFCAVPLLMVIGGAVFGDRAGWGLFMPSLAGLSGALLIFPVQVPGSLRRAVGITIVLGCCVIVAVAGVWMFRLIRGVGVAQVVAIIGITGAVVLGGYGLGVGWPKLSGAVVGVEALRCVVFDLPVVWMTVWLMREVSPVRLSARFLIAPVVTWLEAYAMVRGPVELRSAAALLLMVIGAGMLLVKDESDELPGLHLR